MSDSKNLKKHFGKSFLLAVTAFALIPAFTLWFTQHAQNSRLGRDRYQFQLMESLSQWLLIGGGILILVILALGAIAFINRKAQYISFITGWRLLVLACVVEILAQGIIVVWLSYWLTAFFSRSYYPKLILVAIIMVGLGVFAALIGMFKRVSKPNIVEGELLNRIDAPALWAHIDQLAKKLNTQAPDQIIAGIDTNFFVTEAPMMLNDKKIKGRTLFISIPLLRQLDTSEADAVLAHELSHLKGGDTANSAALSPSLMKCNAYISDMYENPVTRIVYYPLNLYRLIFELALKRESRQREYMADTTAAGLASPRAIVNSLIKIEAYASYRAQTEKQLFSQNRQHGEKIGIAQLIAQGLRDYAYSERFLQDMKNAHIPHPFDSHPALHERMNNVKYTVAEQDFPHIVIQVPSQTWADNIPAASQIEERLWSTYEQQFAQDHEISLAYRFEPANEQEAQTVLKYFPPVQFDLKKNQHVQITYSGLIQQDGELLSWDDFKTINYADGTFSDTLTIIHPDKKRLGRKNSKIKLPGIKKQRAIFKDVLSRYWDRHQIMRAQQAQAAKEAAGTPF